MNARTALCLLTGFFLLSAWAEESQLRGSAPTADSTRRPSPPGSGVEIVNIKDGAVVPTTFLVQFSVTGMDIAPAGTDVPNTGHHHLLIDVETLPDTNLPLPKNEHIHHYGGGQSEVEITLAPGQHTLQLVFADYAHVPHDPVVKSVPITIVVSEEQESKP
jgi:hypothetical protein